MKYTIITADSISELIEKVNFQINLHWNGWKPLGAPFNIVSIFAQAMICD